MTYEELKNRRFLLVVDTALGVEAGSVEKKDSDYNVINIFEIEPLSPNKINLNRNNGPISIKDCVQYKQVGLYMDNVRDESACAEAAKFIAFQIFKTVYKDIDNTKVLIEINFNGNNWITKFKDHPSFYDNVIIKTQRGLLKPGVPVQKMKLQYGFRTTGKTREVAKQRISICNECDHNQKGVCQICGCILKAKVRADFPLDENGKSIDGCPEKKW